MNVKEELATAGGSEHRAETCGGQNARSEFAGELAMRAPLLPGEVRKRIPALSPAILNAFEEWSMYQ